MEKSDNSNSIGVDPGPDLEVCTPQKLRRMYLKYNTMGDNERIEEIELSSEFSQFDESEESESEPNWKTPDQGILSEKGEARKKSFPKLLKSAPERKGSLESLALSSPMQTSFSKRYLNGHRRLTTETEYSEDDNRSIKSK